jgi:hypothetical protein
MHNEELYNLCYSSNVIQAFKFTTRWLGQVAHMGERRGEERTGVHRVLVGKSEGKRMLGRSWGGNIKTDLEEVGVGVNGIIDRSGSVQDRWQLK